MNKRELIKNHLSQLSTIELLRYRLLLCAGELNCSCELKEDLELDITDLFKYPTRLETSYSDNWQKDVLKALFRKLEGELGSANQINESIHALILSYSFSEKDTRTIALFESFLASSQSNNVVLIHCLLQRKIDNLTF